jgi:hypothetical protein
MTRLRQHDPGETVWRERVEDGRARRVETWDTSAAVKRVWLVVVVALVAAAIGALAAILLTSDDELEAKYGLVGVARNDVWAVYEPRVIYRASGSIARVEGYNGCSTDSERVVLVNPMWFREIATRDRWLPRAAEFCA